MAEETVEKSEIEEKVKTRDEVKVAVIACERSVNFGDELNKTKLDGVDNCNIIQVPCSGMIQPRMIQSTFKAGADGVIAMGCQIGDCHFREGNKFCKQRLEGTRPPMIKKTVPRNRLQGYWMNEVQLDEFKARVEAFKDHVANELEKEAQEG